MGVLITQSRSDPRVKLAWNKGDLREPDCYKRTEEYTGTAHVTHGKRLMPEVHEFKNLEKRQPYAGKKKKQGNDGPSEHSQQSTQDLEQTNT